VLLSWFGKEKLSFLFLISLIEEKTMKKIFPLFAGLVLIVAALGTAYAINSNPRAEEITKFNPGHTHGSGETHDAPQHSGGTDAYGCHNVSVPYHCH
jgi:hypothetical protein